MYKQKHFKCEKVVVRISTFTSLKTGYITAYSVMDTMEFVSASFFISSIVILQRGAARDKKVMRKVSHTHTHTCIDTPKHTHPDTHCGT